MKKFLILLVLVQFVTQTFSLDLSIVRGINLKNAMVYSALIAVIFNMAISGGFKLRLPGVHASFAVLSLYAIVSYLMMVFVVRMPDYDAIAAAIFLKSSLLDYFIIFLAFFYGCRTLDDALDVTKALLVGIVFANLITVLDVSGILGLNIIPVRDGIEAGRVQGALGEANQYAAIVVMLLPATVAMIILTTGWKKLFWTGGTLVSVAALLMTISRGALVGLFVGSVAGAFMMRQFVSPAKIMKYALVAGVVLCLAIIALSAQYGWLMYERLIVSTFMSDGVDATSGRNVIWATAVQAMAAAPWTYITGYGFSAYFNMSFEYGTHNDYLALWFDLGLPGVLSFIAIHLQSINVARLAALRAPPEVRPFLISFIIGWIALCIAIFFVNLLDPSIYAWAYLGVSLRAAVQLLDGATGREPAEAPVEPAPVAGRLGWEAPSGSLQAARRGGQPRLIRQSSAPR